MAPGNGDAEDEQTDAEREDRLPQCPGEIQTLRGPLSERSVVSATTTATVRPVSRLWRGRCAGYCATSGTQAAPDESALPAARKTAYGGATGTTE